jgi:hypothetical protein
MLEIDYVAALVDMLRAKGVLRYVTPELSLDLGPAPLAEMPEIPLVGTPRVESDPRIEAALKRLPPGYRDPRLWNIGDSA